MYSNRYLLRAAIASLIAGTPFSVGAAEQAGKTDELEEIMVTGSRVITDDVKSPTPVTSVEIDEIAKTTPSDIPDALNKLPEIMGGRTPRTQGNASTNNGGNTLSLRNFGPQRTLVMLDGHRVPTSNQDGTVNVDILPDMLVKKVDIVTGGASAIYGSDAVAGVVNYVLDKNFTGFKFKMDTGISKYGDGEEGQIGFAWGRDLFDGKGHFETSARYRAQAMIPLSARPLAENGQVWVRGGGGTNANPFVNVPYGRAIGQAQFGNVNCGSACTVNGYTFNQPGELSPLVHGRVIGGQESGGDGGYVKFGTFRSAIEMKNWFGRLSYDFSDNVKGYAEVTWAEAGNKSNWINQVVSTSAGRPSTLFANNPFLTPATQQLLGAGITCPTAGWRCLPATPLTSTVNGTTPPAPPTVPYFSAPSYIWNKVGGVDAVKTGRMYKTEALQKNINSEVGFTGSALGLDWDVFYSHGDSRLTVTNPNNTSNQRYLASLDAVIAPANTFVTDPNSGSNVNVSGQIVCWVTTQPQYASLYPGCVPTNIVDPNGPSFASYDYLRQRTSWTLRQKLDNIGASIGGGLWGIGLPAGEIRANLSFDARWATYKMDSDALPNDFVDCTGLRMCLQATVTGPAGTPVPVTPVLWVQNTNATVDTKNNVYEGALEVNVPLLKDIPLVEELSTDLAGRYIKYSTFSAVEAWKIGLDWHLNSSIRFRSTLSADIRAPNLNDLYQPVGVSSTGFTDLLIPVPPNPTGSNVNGGERLISQGSASLTPEKARTITVGMVLTPSFLPNFNFSVDYYQTKMTNAITNINYSSTVVQNTCLASAPNYDNAFCKFADRPITNPTDPAYRTPANLASQIYARPFNSATQVTHGFDAQFNYRWEMLSGKFNLRHLVSYQPVNETVSIPGTNPTWAVAPKLRQTTFLSYQNSDWTLSLQNQYMSSLSLVSTAGQVYRDPKIKAYDVVDLTVSKRLESWTGAEVFLSISNLNNAKAPLVGDASGVPGLFYPTLGFYDDTGRFFTLGLRVGF